MLISSTSQQTPYREQKRLSFSESLNQQAKREFYAGSVEKKVEGLTFREALALARPESVRATTGDRINPASDALLINLVDKMPIDLGRMTLGALKRWITSGDGAPEAHSTKSSDYVIGKQEPVKLGPLMNTLQAVMAEFPEFEPHIGEEHVWSPEAKLSQGASFPARLGMALKGERPFPVPIFGSKLISALGLGATSIVLPTGKEGELKNVILERDLGSVELHDLFREAYRLNEGDLYGTLLTAENVLSEGVYDPDRKDREVTRRLSYLRSDSEPHGDNFGAWYHLFGSALYSLMRPEWKANLAMKIEGAGSFILEGSDPQEDHLNKLGVELGKALKQVANSGLNPLAKAEPYLNLTEFSWDRKLPSRSDS